jgi:probable F420-dependent oxidoreductase
MQFGLSICPEVGRYSETLEQTRVAEKLGYDSVWLPEHHLMAGYVPSPMLGLAAVAAVTDRIALGTDVAILPFYPPVRLAEEAAMLADMSGARFFLGVGLGYRPEEFAAFGIPYEQRGARMTEGLSIVRDLLRRENVTYEGDHFSLREVTVHPRPQVEIPILVGGWSAPALRRAAELGDAWFPGPTADLNKLRMCLDIYERELASRGKTRTEFPIFREVWVADEPALLREGVDRLQALYVDDYLTWQHRNVEADAGDPWDDLRRDRFIVGSPTDVADEIARYREELGITHLVARMHFHASDHRAVLRSMELFAEQAMPTL